MGLVLVFNLLSYQLLGGEGRKEEQWVCIKKEVVVIRLGGGVSLCFTFVTSFQQFLT